MKIHFLGTCSGTEPMHNRKHVSFVVEKDDSLYWFDAGEGCSYTAHLMGLDLLSVRNIFISHSHMDHIGGLGNLVWNIRKISNLTEDNLRKIAGKNINVYIPNIKAWNGLMQLLLETEGGFDCSFNINANRVKDGEIYRDKGVSVEALHNHHLPKGEDGEWKSYSYCIYAEGKKVVYSADVKSIRDIDTLIDKCDLLLMETGHHKVEDVCCYLKDNNKKVKTLGFIHHGRAILRNAEKELQKAKAIFGDNVFIAEDKTTIEM